MIKPSSLPRMNTTCGVGGGPAHTATSSRIPATLFPKAGNNDWASIEHEWNLRRIVWTACCDMRALLSFDAVWR